MKETSTDQESDQVRVSAGDNGVVELQEQVVEAVAPGEQVPSPAVTEPIDPEYPEEEEAYSIISREEYAEKVTAEYLEMQRRIQELRGHVIRAFSASPDTRDTLLRSLSAASAELEAVGEADVSYLALVPIRDRITFIEAALESEARRTSTLRFSTTIVALLVCIFALVAVILAWTGAVSIDRPAETLNEDLLLGIPVPVWIWALIGSLTSMLLRAGQTPFDNKTDAVRWLIYRSLVGVVMGVIIYLLLVAGLIVFAGTPETQSPELIWVVAFLGSFSDTLSVNLLRKLMGSFKNPADTPAPLPAAENETAATQVLPGSRSGVRTTRRK